ncbi:head-tail adaptor protein [Allorhizobium sp. BGMRC 0089]|uniref:head-tail adaptor protein n=1 Tax=Allorhizobium sonneratiae TaxID=2934936 RepID=UPI002033FF34|nr:head-tail adaptor protein [Allorhizobium sonneratiae]MCM2292292.1 head-tail adaptor protein [Allorhizobium sonneratiae]
MAGERTTGDLKHTVAFETREERDRGDGVTVGVWQERFRCRAGYVHLRGGESVMADRLQGQHTQVIFVRVSRAAKQVGTDWRIRDLDSGALFNIRDVTPQEYGPGRDRRFVDFLCQSGVST